MNLQAELTNLERDLVLVSQSPRRKELLQQLHLNIRVIDRPGAELNVANLSGDWSSRIAQVAEAKLSGVSFDRPAIALAADTLVLHNEQPLGKPASSEEAKTMLERLQNTEHAVITAFCLKALPEGVQVVDNAVTRVRFRSLSKEEIDDYIALEKPFDKAGAYGIQDSAAAFVESIIGEYTNVVGLPLTRFALALRRILRTLASEEVPS